MIKKGTYTHVCKIVKKLVALYSTRMKIYSMDISYMYMYMYGILS